MFDVFRTGSGEALRLGVYLSVRQCYLSLETDDGISLIYGSVASGSREEEAIARVLGREWSQ